jgi:hypothetical protein
MKHEIIKTDNYLLIVDDSDIAGYDYKNFDVKDFSTCFWRLKAHLPLNGSPILEGVDLLPSFENVNEIWQQGLVAELDKLPYTKHLDDGQYNDGQMTGFELGANWGYDTAKEKYKWTDKDMRKAMAMCKGEFTKGVVYTQEQVIQSLQQPKMPVAFECELKYNKTNHASGLPLSGHPIMDKVILQNYSPKTTVNLQNQTLWVGEYIYE